MGKVFVIANQKGGVGKTTTTINLGAYIAAAGKRVLLIDFDPQGNMSSGFGMHDKEYPGIYNALSGSARIEEIIQPTVQRNLELAPADLNLSGAAIELASEEEREYYLRQTIEPVRDLYDYILIDCPPSLGVLTINGFVASDYVLIPLQCEFFALEGLLVMMVNTIKTIQTSFNPGLRIGGIIFTMYDGRTRLGNEVIQQVKASFRNNRNILFETIIPRNVKLSEAPSHGLPINMYDPLCVGARSYECLSGEVMQVGCSG